MLEAQASGNEVATAGRRAGLDVAVIPGLEMALCSAVFPSPPDERSRNLVTCAL